MKMYYFLNPYLSSIQQGIQSLHVTAEMFLKYPAGVYDKWDASVLDEKKSEAVDAWARDHKVVILKNGGGSTSLKAIEDRFREADNPYPWASFREDELEDALTGVGILIPDWMSDLTENLRNMPYRLRDEQIAIGCTNEFEVFLVNLLMSTGLAR